MHVICLLIISRKQTHKKLKLHRVVEEEERKKRHLQGKRDCIKICVNDPIFVKF